MEQTTSGTTSGRPEPVTVVVSRKVRKGKEAEYEHWLERLLYDTNGMPGYLGATVHRPVAGAQPVYTSVFRFDSVDTLRAFEESDLRARYLREVVDYVEADAVWKRMTGLEFWFTPPAGTVVAQPSRARMAVLLIAVVYLMVLSIGAVVGIVLGNVSYPVRLLITITIEIYLMTYFLMPWLTRLLARWIYPATKSAGT